MNKPADWKPDWKLYRQEFAWDGSWRDIYVLNTSTSDWQRFLDFLRTSRYPYDFSLSGRPAPLPPDVVTIFSTWANEGPLLSIDLGAVVLKCHFFTVQEIEFDLDPRNVDEESKAQAIFKFMEGLARTLERSVRMTPENSETTPIFEFDPGVGRLAYYPCSEGTT
jgi:hypothetical protein